jgi:hypothetical protein
MFSLPLGWSRAVAKGFLFLLALGWSQPSGGRNFNYPPNQPNQPLTNSINLINHSPHKPSTKIISFGHTNYATL